MEPVQRRKLHDSTANVCNSPGAFGVQGEHSREEHGLQPYKRSRSRVGQDGLLGLRS